MQISDVIYGTFPDLPGSQQVVHKSESLDEELQGWLINCYDQFGDCRSEEFKTSLAVVWHRADEGAHIASVTRITQQQKDFSGRWGALLRHTAIMSEDDYRQIGYLPLLLSSQLIGKGTSEELKQRADLHLELSQPLRASEVVVGVSIDNYRVHLARLLAGERLILYADAINDYLSGYLNTLVALLPAKARALLNWSHFLFRSWEEIGLSIVHNSRYQAPIEGIPAFVTEGESSLTSLELTDDEISEYLDRLTVALNDGVQEELSKLLDADDWRESADSEDDEADDAAESPEEGRSPEDEQEKSGEAEDSAS